MTVNLWPFRDSIRLCDNNLFRSQFRGEKSYDTIMSCIFYHYFEPIKDPVSFPTEELWKARENVDTSVAVKCPSVQYHLMTNKVNSRIRAKRP